MATRLLIQRSNGGSFSASFIDEADLQELIKLRHKGGEGVYIERVVFPSYWEEGPKEMVIEWE